MLTIENRDGLFTLLKEGATLITPNNRLSNQFIDSFVKQYGTFVQTKPRCFPYQAFLRDLYKKARHLYAKKNHPMLLTQQQKNYLWRQTLTEQQLRCNDGLLCEVQNAWTRCMQWEIDSHHPAFDQTPQTQQFQQWQQHFEAQLKTLGALTEDTLAHHLLSYPELFNESTIIWACFDDYTPELRTLQQAIEAHGGQQYTYDLAHRDTPTHVYPAMDTADEYLQMIKWLRSKLQAGDTQIAVVIPDLEAQSRRLQRLLQRHIPPNLFNISLGQSLIDYPLVAHALNWLELDGVSVTNHQARLLLHSPYLAYAQTEFIARAEAMEDPKVLQEPIILLKTLIQTLSRTTPSLVQLLDSLPDYPEQASPSAWIDHFKQRLVHLGFPGEYLLNSVAYQCFQRFMVLFDELLQLSVINPMMNKADALNALHTLAKSTIFQPEKSTAPIQILGLLEASGCTFNSVWVTGLTDQCLPQKTNFSAFIPLHLQRERLMPHALPHRELQFAEQLLQRLQNGSNDCVFSYPRMTGDSPNLPSPLISHLPVLAIPASTDDFKHSLLIKRDELYALPLTPAEPVSGGTTLLANQAKCPFRAFAAHRLTAKASPAASDGPDASVRGQIMHKIMDLLWRDLGGQQQLLALTPKELNTQIQNVILRALTPLIDEGRQSFSPLVQAVEVSRLQRLVNASLDWEKQRPAFVIEAVEQDFTLELAGINFRVRVDRLDKIIASDKKWVIDYKSSLPINKPWNEDRPEAPQLLLYALLDARINALLFVQLKAGRLTCSGLSEEDVLMQGISTLKRDESWSLRQEQWQQQLTELAHEFKTGHCPPQPFRKSTCLRCDFPHLCRIEQH